MHTPMSSPEPDADGDRRRLAEAVRAACVEAALRAYEDAGLSGLCAEGRFECAVGALRTLDLGALVAPTAEDARGSS